MWREGEMCREGHLQQEAVFSPRLSAGGLVCMYKHTSIDWAEEQVL